MRLSGFHMPRWWQALWCRRYPMGVNGQVDVWVEGDPNDPRQWYTLTPMPCGCGYCVYWHGERVGEHRPTLGGAIRQARKHAQSYAREAQV